MENETPNQEETKEAETPEASNVPEKFLNPQTGEVNIDALVKSYTELEKRLSQNPAAPKSPDDYCIDCDHGLFEVDPEINERLHAKGFTQDQAQEVYDLASEKMVPMVQQMSGDFAADREVEKLISHFGGQEQWQEVSRQLLAYGHQNLPEDVLAGLSSSYEGVIALHKMMGSEEPALGKKAKAPNAMDEKDLQSMMKDPKYWRDKDPAYVAKVTQGFESMYSNKS